MNPTPEQVAAVMDRFAKWVPEINLRLHSAVANGTGMYELEDGAAPFLSEACLYNLLGKEEGRTLLAFMHQLLEAAGVSRQEQWNRWRL